MRYWIGWLAVSLSWSGALAAELKFEAEDYSEPKTAWLANQESPDHWNLWSTDVDAQLKWSGGVVLRAPAVTANRATPEEGAPPLHTRLTNIPPGLYDIELKVGRTLGVSLDGQTWLPYSGGQLVERANLKDGVFEVWVDDRFVNPGGPGSGYYDCVILTPVTAPPVKPRVHGAAKRRVEERFDRALVAVDAPQGVYLSWRLLKSDPADLAFNVYRRIGRGPGVRLNDAPIVATTDFLDTTAPADRAELSYAIRGVRAGRLGPDEANTSKVLPGCVTIKLDAPVTTQKLGIGDLNGDGRLDYVIKQPSDNIDPYKSYWKPSPDTYQIEAYDHGGRFLWRYDMGWAIERGIWYSPYLVYDFDGDGRAEVAVKAGEGDPRGEDGRVFSGPEWLVVLDGRTGRERARAPWPSREGFGDGDAGYNYAARNQLAVAYLDGRTPFLIALRGTYTIMKAEAWELRGNQLQPTWSYSSDEAGRRWRGQGAHFTHAADVDADGRDEVILGSAALDDTGAPLWSTGRGHPDKCWLGDLDPTRPGLEIYYFIESRGTKNGMAVCDPRTGEYVWGFPEPTGHLHGGFCADIDPRYPGSECYTAEVEGDHKANGRQWLWTAQGELLSTQTEYGMGVRTAWWDGDLQREIIRGGRLKDHEGGFLPTSFQGSVVLVADLLGDWREEIVASVAGELRIYTTNLPAQDRRPCLLQDPIYRLDTAMNAMAYVQEPTLGYSLETAAANLNLTAVTPTDAAPSVRVVVVASQERGLKGQVQLSAAGATITPATLAVDLQPGARLVQDCAVSPASKGGEATVTATLTSGEAPRSSSVVVRLPEKILTEVLKAQAEAFTAQGGGEVQIRSDKVGADGRCLSHWDAAGHWLEWAVDVPQAGRYQLVARYCFEGTATRAVSLDGQPVAETTFIGTGGMGTNAADWLHQPVANAQGPVVVTLTAGRHVIRMTNLNGKGCNLDYVALVPAK